MRVREYLGIPYFIDDGPPRRVWGIYDMDEVKTGIVKGIVTNRNFGFLKSGNIEYFFHRDDFNGHWDDLLNDIIERDIHVNFEVVADSPKGPRAKNVKRTDYPN